MKIAQRFSAGNPIDNVTESAKWTTETIRYSLAFSAVRFADW